MSEMKEKQQKELIELLDRVKLQEHNPLEEINLFSILGMENKEVSAHSAFLYYIFKPFKNGKGIDEENANLLLKQIVDADKEYSNISVYREYSTNYGRLDFFITYKTNVSEERQAIVVELKIWAGEQPKQLERYRKFLNENGYKNGNVYFLTPGSRKNQTGGNDVINKTLKKDIVCVLEQVCERKNILKYKEYISSIKQYISLCKKISGDTFMEYKEVIKNVEDIKKIDQLYDYRKEALGDLLSKVMETINNECSDYWFEPRFMEKLDNKLTLFKSDISDYYVYGKRSWPAIAAKIDKEKIKTNLREAIDNQDEKIEVFFFIEIGEKLYSGLTLRKVEGDVIRGANANVDVENENNKIGIGETKDSWLYWENLEYKNYEIDFEDYANEETGMLRLFEGMELEKDFVKNIKDSMEDVKKQISKYYIIEE
ncbi:MAG: PD-(D/E)XK nuclease family protein [Eubacterium sp.]|nr:PD-(D/E)XK nuclease family protein [Eubacterium sp.]